jgi:hypothetical protein
VIGFRFITPICLAIASAISMLRTAVSVSCTLVVNPFFAQYALPMMTIMHRASMDLLNSAMKRLLVIKYQLIDMTSKSPYKFEVTSAV